MTDDGRAGHRFAPAGWNFAEELVKETGTKLAFPFCYIRSGITKSQHVMMGSKLS